MSFDTYSNFTEMSSNAHSASFTVFKGSPGGKIVQDTTHRVLDDNSVLVKITHSGLCFTDVHFREQNMVLGHEGVGIVERVGAGCKDLKSSVGHSTRRVHLRS